jgi:uncharacterized protein YjdB
MKTINKFIKNNWFIILPWLLVIIFLIYLVIKSESPRPITPPKDNRIDSLSHVVDSLNTEYNKLKHNYDSAQANARVEIQKIYIQNAKDVSNIRSYTVDQCDSMWSTLNP